MFGETIKTPPKAPQTELLESIMNMSNNVDHLDALEVLDWKPLKTERIKAKSKLMFRLFNKMGPKSLTDLFTFKSEMTTYKLRDIESTLCLPTAAY